jgi:DNA ligase (NAD+)
MAKDIKTELEKLRGEIRRHDDLYYQKDRPEISDQEYDALLRRLIDLEAEHPDLVTPDSPTQRVGGKAIDAFKSVRHAQRMMSIDNTYSEDEVRDFDTRVRKLLKEAGETGDFTYTCEPKIDGVSLSTRYEGGVLKMAATRGDGTSGDDVTHNVKTIHDVPLVLKGLGDKDKGLEKKKKDEQPSLLTPKPSPLTPPVLEVRGEVFLSRAQFAKINQQQEDAGEEPYANPRNTAAGSLKQLDPGITRERKLEFIPHGQGEVVGVKFETYSEWQAFLKKIGFRANEHFQKCETIDDVIKYIEKFAETRKKLPYDTDGVVVKVDRFDLRETLGATAKSPRWCIAYKYQPEQAVTQVVRVVFQVGKTGTITPVGEFEPVPFISGTNVYRASLHNFDEIDRKDIHLNDYVTVEKAGEVIPYVVGVVKEKRPDNAKKITRPKECPSCESKDLAHDGGFVRCKNPACPAKMAGQFIYWTGRNQMDIGEVGEKLIEKLMAKGLLKSIPDLYRLEHADVFEALKREDTKDSNPAKAAQNVIDAIAASKDRGLARVLAGLGILHIGVRTAQVITESFPTLDALESATFEEILSAPDMGGGVLEDLRRYQERYADLKEISPEQIFGFEPIPAAIRKKLESNALKGPREKSPMELIEEIRGKGVAAQSLYSFLHSKEGKRTLDELKTLGVKMDEPRAVRSGPQPLAGMTIVVTGTLKHFKRNEIEEKISSLGGKATGSVSKNTTFVLAGEEAGSKLDKARKLGVEVIDEEEFKKRIGEK